MPVSSLVITSALLISHALMVSNNFVLHIVPSRVLCIQIFIELRSENHLYIFVDYFVSCVTRIDNCNDELILIGAYCVALCNLLSEKIFHLCIKLTLFCVCMYIYVYMYIKPAFIFWYVLFSLPTE